MSLEQDVLPEARIKRNLRYGRAEDIKQDTVILTVKKSENIKLKWNSHLSKPKKLNMSKLCHSLRVHCYATLKLSLITQT